MKKTLIAALAGAFALTANAGDYSKEVTEVIAVDDSIGATISAGYMTDYIFYGVDLGNNAVWTGVDYSLESLGVPLDVGVWYINPTDSSYDELDVYAGYSLPSFAGVDASLNFVAYFFPQTSADATYELNLALSYDAGFVDVVGLVAYDFEIEGWYFMGGISKGFAISDDLEIVLSATIGGQNDYWASSGFWNDVQVKAALPIALTDNATLEPYIGGLFALDATEDLQDDIVHGGVSLSVSF